MSPALFWYLVAGAINGILIWMRERAKEEEQEQPEQPEQDPRDQPPP